MEYELIALAVTLKSETMGAGDWLRVFVDVQN